MLKPVVLFKIFVETVKHFVLGFYDEYNVQKICIYLK